MQRSTLFTALARPSAPFFLARSPRPPPLALLYPGTHHGASERGQRVQQQKRLQGEAGVRRLREGVPKGELE